MLLNFALLLVFNGVKPSCGGLVLIMPFSIIVQRVLSQLISFSLHTSGITRPSHLSSCPSSGRRFHYLEDTAIIIHKNMHLQINGRALCMLLHPYDVFGGIFNSG